MLAKLSFIAVALILCNAINHAYGQGESEAGINCNLSCTSDCSEPTDGSPSTCSVRNGYPSWTPGDYIACPKNCSCAFPFLYNGQVYSYCTTADSYVSWCSTVEQYDGLNWIYC